MITPAMLDLGSIVFAVVASEAEDVTKLAWPNIFGTAFCIGPGVFLTAAHVAENARATGTLTVVGIRQDGPLRAFQAKAVELHKDYDCAIIGCPVDNSIAILDWQMESMALLTDVHTVGFPYAVTAEETAFKVSLRGIKGYVITRRKIWKLPGKPVGYELSCAFPKGLSGAPLMTSIGGMPMRQLAGMVVGTGSVEIEGEVTNFGEAVDIQALATIDSELVGGTLTGLRQWVMDYRTLQAPDFTKPVLSWPTEPRFKAK